MANTAARLVSSLKQRFGETLLDAQLAFGQAVIEITPGHLLEVCQSLKDEEEFSFSSSKVVIFVFYRVLFFLFLGFFDFFYILICKFLLLFLFYDFYFYS